MPRFRSADRGRDREASGVGRLYIVGAFFALCFALLASRAVAFHLKDNRQLEKVALRQYRTAVMENSMRGKIVDAEGRDLAIDVTADSIFANPREIENAAEASARLAGVLSLDRKRLLERLSSRRKFVWVKRWATPEETALVKEAGIGGVYSMKEGRRSYPNGTVGANLLGAVGLDGEPLGGVELYYDDSLAMRSRTEDLRRDARGHLYLSPTGGEERFDRRSVRLTIDKTMQYISDSELESGVRGANAKGGDVVVVDVRTGRILAMSGHPTFDPNEYSKYPLSSWRNGAVVDPKEPGSTFKVIVVAAALDSGLVSPEDVLDCEGGKIGIGKHVIRDAHPYRMLSVAEIIKLSSNIGAYKVSQRLGRQRVYESIRSFGFGKKSGIDLPGETAGILSSYKEWSPVQDATVAFGQGISVTPLQMAMAFAAIANGGNLMRPYVVERIEAGDGTAIMERRPEVVSQPIRPETARTMIRLLEAVVEEKGTGTLASSIDYRVAGKTGTAQKVDFRSGVYAKGRYYSSFVGFAPVEDPRIAVFVGIDEPHGQYYGGQVAAPVFRRIVEKVLRYMKVPAGKAGAVPMITADVQPAAHSAEDVPAIVSDGDEAQQVVRRDEESWVLPDFRGMTMRGVLAAAGDAFIEWNFHGSGIAVRQWPEPGSALASGGVCRVEFRPLM
ncbi:MAG: transpeptidase family protein [Proteobacteria bacterium]|nr:transpeptidase family protein [Pseudomonadota bacterium]